MKRTPTRRGGRFAQTLVAAIGLSLLLISGVSAVANTTPTAVATISPQSVYPGDTVTLNGSQSHPNGTTPTTLTYSWQRQAPTSPPVNLLPDGKSVIATFSAPSVPAGQNSLPVAFTLKVQDKSVPGSNQNGTSDSVSTTVYAPAVANAGPNQEINLHGANVTTVVTLDGSQSSTSTGVIAYTWKQTGGPTVVFSGSTTAHPSFVTPALVPYQGIVLSFQLTVDEGNGSLPHRQSAPATVNITVDDVNAPPFANAGPNQTVGEKSLVTLQGSGTDSDNDPLTCVWTQVHDASGAQLQPGDPIVKLSDAASAQPSFTAPEVSAALDHIDLTFCLKVSDGFTSSGPSYVTVTVQNTNNPPTAAAVATANGVSSSAGGTLGGVVEGDSVGLDGSGSSDPDQDALTYSWTQISGPVVILSGSDSPNASFTAPLLTDQGGNPLESVTLSFQLLVSDGELSNTSTVNVNVANVNHSPVADAGKDQNVPDLILDQTTGYSFSVVSLDGSGSYDPDSDPLTYSWELTQVEISGSALDRSAWPQISLTGSNTATPNFTAPAVPPSGESLTFTLTTSDPFGGTSSNQVKVNLSYVNRPPVAIAGNAQAAEEGTVVMLSGSASDPDSNPLTYSWSQVSGPVVSLSDPSALNPSFTAPLIDRNGVAIPPNSGSGPVVLRLTVADGYGGGASSDVAITIRNLNHPPVADVTGNTSVYEGDPVALTGNGTDSDTEEQNLLVSQWQYVGAKLNGTALVLAVNPQVNGSTLSFAAPTIPGGDPNAKLELTFRFTVTDPNYPNDPGAIDTKEVVVCVSNDNPTANAGSNQTVNEGATVTLNGLQSSDPDNKPLTYTWIQTEGLAVMLNFDPLNDPQGKMPWFTAPYVTGSGARVKFQLTVDNGFGGTSSASTTVTVNNINDPPVIVGQGLSQAQNSAPVLWPPDHRLVPVQIVDASQPVAPLAGGIQIGGFTDVNHNAKVSVLSVTQDEPTGGLGDGDSPVDAIINHDPVNGDTVLIRAERSGKGDGRVYTISYTAWDFEGSVSGTVRLQVPHDKKGDVSKDSGQLYDATR